MHLKSLHFHVISLQLMRGLLWGVLQADHLATVPTNQTDNNQDECKKTNKPNKKLGFTHFLRHHARKL